jgi:hypothetical protein
VDNGPQNLGSGEWLFQSNGAFPVLTPFSITNASQLCYH